MSISPPNIQDITDITDIKIDESPTETVPAATAPISSHVVSLLTTEQFIKRAEQMKKKLAQYFSGQTIRSSSIPMIVLHTMILARDYSDLKGAQKEQLVTLVVQQWIASIDVDSEDRLLIEAVLPTLLPALIEVNFHIDQTVQTLFKKTKQACGAMGCFKKQ